MTANDVASNDKFGSRVAFSRDTLLAVANGKYGDMGKPMNLSLQEMDRAMKE